MRHSSPVLLLALAALGACAGAPVAPTPGSSKSTPAPSPASSGAAPSQPGQRTETDLKRALLTADDLPAGPVLVPSQTSGGTASSADPQCATLVAITNTPTAIGSLQHVKERLSGGARGPFVDQAIDELDSANGVAAEQAQLKDALANCAAITITDPGRPPSTVEFKSVPPPRAGQDPVALRATVVAGANAGFEFTQVIAGVADTVVSLSFVDTPQNQIDQITPAAIDRAARVLAGTT